VKWYEFVDKRNGQQYEVEETKEKYIIVDTYAFFLSAGYPAVWHTASTHNSLLVFEYLNMESATDRLTQREANKTSYIHLKEKGAFRISQPATCSPEIRAMFLSALTNLLFW
jgi:hypothetical protein